MNKVRSECSSGNLHFDSRRVVSVEPPHASTVGTSGSVAGSCGGSGFSKTDWVAFVKSH